MIKAPFKKLEVSPLKMHRIENIIWLVGIGLMAAILLVSFQSPELLKRKTVEKDGAANTLETVASETDSQTGTDSLSPATAKPMLASIGTPDGYKIKTDLAVRYITIEKENGKLWLEFRVDPEEKTLQAFIDGMKKNHPEIKFYDGFRGWKYYYNLNWDSKWGTTAVANIRRTFLKEKDRILVIADQYDYSSGAYDWEVNEIIKGTVLSGASW